MTPRTLSPGIRKGSVERPIGRWCQHRLSDTAKRLAGNIIAISDSQSLNISYIET